MEHHKISKLLNNSTVSKSVTRKWIEVNDLSNGQYSVNRNIRSKTPMLKSGWFDYSDADIVVKGKINRLAAAANENDGSGKDVPFKNNTPFRLCIPKRNSTLIGNADNLNIVMLMYNLLEWSHNYFMTSDILWNYYRHKIHDVDVNDNTSDIKSFENKTKLVVKAP